MQGPEETEASAHDNDGAGAGVCSVAWCPFCMAASAVQPISPEVVGHLLKAGSELFLAFRSAIDGRADDLAGEAPAAPVRLEKIDVG